MLRNATKEDDVSETGSIGPNLLSAPASQSKNTLPVWEYVRNVRLGCGDWLWGRGGCCFLGTQGQPVEFFQEQHGAVLSAGGDEGKDGLQSLVEIFRVPD